MAGAHLLRPKAGVVGVHAILCAAIICRNAVMPVAEGHCCGQPWRAQYRQRERQPPYCHCAWLPMLQRCLLLLHPLPELHCVWGVAESAAGCLSRQPAGVLVDCGAGGALPDAGCR